MRPRSGVGFAWVFGIATEGGVVRVVVGRIYRFSRDWVDIGLHLAVGVWIHVGKLRFEVS